MRGADISDHRFLRAILRYVKCLRQQRKYNIEEFRTPAKARHFEDEIAGKLNSLPEKIRGARVIKVVQFDHVWYVVLWAATGWWVHCCFYIPTHWLLK